MHFPTDWADYLKVENHKVVRVVESQYMGSRDIPSDVECYKENDDGEAWCRNLYQSMWGGYVVAFPGQKVNSTRGWYYNDNIATVEEWSECSIKKSLGWSNPVHENSMQVVLSVYPEFKYMFKKYEFNNLRDLMEKLVMWKKHPEIELLLAAGFERLAMNKTLYKMTAEHRKEIAIFCRNNPDANMLTLREIRECIKHPGAEFLYIGFFNLVPAYKRKGWTRETYNYWGDFTIEDYKYLLRMHKASTEGLSLFGDYIRILKVSPHDINDPYWRYPKDIQKAHDKLLKEEAKLKMARDKLRNKEKAKNLSSVCKKYSKYNAEIGDYNIYVTNNLDDWEKQASVLSQCILRADYPAKMSERKCVLFFIRKADVPIATIEILPGKKVGQFYGNEIDRSNCLPPEDVKNLVLDWVENKLVMKEAI